MLIDTLEKKLDRTTKRATKICQEADDFQSHIKVELCIEHLLESEIEARRRSVIKEQIRALLDKTPNLDQVDIANRLNRDLGLVCQLCDELLAEGKIKRIPY